MRKYCLLILLASSIAAVAQNVATVPVTFYFPEPRHWASNYNLYSKPASLGIREGESNSKLFQLDPGTFITITLPAGEHTFRAHRGATTTKPITAVLDGSPIFIRARLSAGGYHLEVVPCSEAASEIERTSPLKAKQIHVPISQVRDDGAYFHANCADSAH